MATLARQVQPENNMCQEEPREKGAHYKDHSPHSIKVIKLLEQTIKEGRVCVLLLGTHTHTQALHREHARVLCE